MKIKMISNRDKHFMLLAFIISEQSKCIRAQYGSVLVSSDGRIVSTGYNGKPRGSINDDICYRVGLQPNTNVVPDCCLHSEANCLLFASPEEKIGSTLYVSGIPCENCSLMIAQSKISRLVYYTGEQAHGHSGDFNLDFYNKYGMKYELIAMDEI